MLKDGVNNVKDVEQSKNKKMLCSFFVENKKLLCTIISIILILVATISILGHYYTLHNFDVYRRFGMWDYRTIGTSIDSKEIQIYTNSNSSNILIPNELNSKAVRDVIVDSNGSTLKAYLKDAEYKVKKIKLNKYSESSLVLCSVNPNNYSDLLDNSNTSLNIKNCYVPKASLDCYRGLYEEDEFGVVFSPANISYLWNYDYDSQEKIYWETKYFKHNAYKFFRENNIDVDDLTEDDWGKYYQEHCKGMIDASLYNDGYYWVDYLNVGEKIIFRPEDPERDGYVFSGWYLDNECTILFDFYSYVKGDYDLVLYSGWEKI